MTTQRDEGDAAAQQRVDDIEGNADLPPNTGGDPTHSGGADVEANVETTRDGEQQTAG